MRGGELRFEMTDEPNTKWAAKNEYLPPSSITEELITPVPYVRKGARTFYNSCEVELGCIAKNAKIYYTLDGTNPNINSHRYLEPKTIHDFTTLKMFSITDEHIPSPIVSAQFYKLSHRRTIKLFTDYAAMYSAGGPSALIDNIRGANNFRTGDWQGYQGCNLDAVVDLGNEQNIKHLPI